VRWVTLTAAKRRRPQANILRDAVPYPQWTYFPPWSRPPEWVEVVVNAFALTQPAIDSATHSGLNSNAVLSYLRPRLVDHGFDVEAGKRADQKLRRPVLFGEAGTEELAYEVDAFHPTMGIALEVEAGRGIMGNAIYRDLIQASLMIDAEFLVLAVMSEYRYRSGGKTVLATNYRMARNVIGAIYASERLQLPFRGLLLLGY
jgi:hypothetical protein